MPCGSRVTRPHLWEKKEKISTHLYQICILNHAARELAIQAQRAEEARHRGIYVMNLFPSDRVK